MPVSTSTTATKRLLAAVVADASEDVETMVFVNFFRAIGFDVDLACPGKEPGSTIRMVLHEMDPDGKYQTYVEKLGHTYGRGPEYLVTQSSVLDLIRSFFDQRKPVMSVCHGQLILGAAGVLAKETRTLCPYPNLKRDLEMMSEGRVKFQEVGEKLDKAVTDGNLVTAAWPSGLPDFLKHCMALLGVKIDLPKQQPKILALCGDLMENMKIAIPVASFEAAGFQVYKVCPQKPTGALCQTAVYDVVGKMQGLVEVMDAVYVPGGRAPEYLKKYEDVIGVAREFMRREEMGEKAIGVFGSGVMIPFATSALRGRKVSSIPMLTTSLATSGVQVQDVAKSKTMVVRENRMVSAAHWTGLSDENKGNFPSRSAEVLQEVID
ncbi:hypothetical protein HK102_012380 [Quaeritorhiza haematococci]|nr:hypothetical protein HK102_012380 [Quaeritorhiza haematococci]